MLREAVRTVVLKGTDTKSNLYIRGAAASVGKVKDVYRQVLHLKNVDMAFLTAVREKLEQYIEINSGFRIIYIQVDMS